MGNWDEILPCEGGEPLAQGAQKIPISLEVSPEMGLGAEKALAGNNGPPKITLQVFPSSQPAPHPHSPHQTLPDLCQQQPACRNPGKGKCKATNEPSGEQHRMEGPLRQAEHLFCCD